MNSHARALQIVCGALIVAQGLLQTAARAESSNGSSPQSKRSSNLVYDRNLLGALESAKFSLTGREFKQAESKFRDIINKYPAYPDGYEGIATCRAAIKDFRGAKFYYELALSKNPKSLKTLASLAKLYDEQGDRENCINCFRKLVASDNTKTNWLILGDVYARYGDRENSLKCYQKALTLKPNDADVWVALGFHAIDSNNFKEAEQRFQKALSCDSKNKEAKHQLAKILLKQGRIDEAEKLFVELVTAYPKGEFWTEFGIIAIKKDDLRAAEERFSMALTLFPNKPQNVLNWAVILEMKGQPKEAEAFYRTAIKIAPNYLSAHLGLGQLLLEAGRLKEAREEFNRVTVLAPSNMDGWFFMGVVCSELGESHKAIDCLQKAIRLQPNNVNLMCDLATAYRQSGEKKRAEQVARRALQMAPKSEATLCTFGVALLDLKRYDEAIKRFQTATKLFPKRASIWNNLGAAETLNGDLKKAEIAFRKAIAIDPKYMKGWANLATILEQSGDREGAKKALAEAAKGRAQDHTLLYDVAQSLERLGEQRLAVDARKIGLDKEPDEADLLMSIPYFTQQASEADARRTSGKSARNRRGG